METAAEFAKKYGLEQYLDKPDDLNDAIFNLMLLQETVQLEQARKMKIGRLLFRSNALRRARLSPRVPVIKRIVTLWKRLLRQGRPLLRCFSAGFLSECSVVWASRRTRLRNFVTA
jgi:hypothetical protein